MSESSLRISATHLAVRRRSWLAALLLLSPLAGCNLSVTRGSTNGTPPPEDACYQSYCDYPEFC